MMHTLALYIRVHRMSKKSTNNKVQRFLAAEDLLLSWPQVSARIIDLR